MPRPTLSAAENSRGRQDKVEDPPWRNDRAGAETAARAVGEGTGGMLPSPA